MLELRQQDIICSCNSSFQSVNQTLVSIPTASERSRASQATNLVEYVKFKKGRDSPSEARSALLFIAVLVATATFQVGVGPPGGA